MRMCLLGFALALLAVPMATLGVPQSADAAKKDKPAAKFPWDDRVSDATRYARGRAGRVSFAVVDERGRIHGRNRGARYSSASLVKAMLLTAYVRRGSVRNRRLHGSERGLLGPMIRVSDNAAADGVMAQVGTAGLNRLGRRAGMRRFSPSPAWGGSQVTARDQALFFSKLEQLLPDRHRSYALGLLADIAPSQRWGIPGEQPKGWRTHFKGGWYPGDGGWRVSQAALLRRGNRSLGIAVLTEGGPSLGNGAATIKGVARRLLRGYQ
jgi:hypothetical protein